MAGTISWCDVCNQPTEHEAEKSAMDPAGILICLRHEPTLRASRGEVPKKADKTLEDRVKKLEENQLELVKGLALTLKFFGTVRDELDDSEYGQ